jgi:hypothetical protein
VFLLAQDTSLRALVRGMSNSLANSVEDTKGFFQEEFEGSSLEFSQRLGLHAGDKPRPSVSFLEAPQLLLRLKGQGEDVDPLQGFEFQYGVLAYPRGALKKCIVKTCVVGPDVKHRRAEHPRLSQPLERVPDQLPGDAEFLRDGAGRGPAFRHQHGEDGPLVVC